MKLCPPHKTSFNGRIIQAGEAVEIFEADAAALIAKGWSHPEIEEPLEESIDETTEQIETNEEI